MTLTSTLALLSGLTRTTRLTGVLYPIARLYAGMFLSVAIAVFYRAPRQNLYNMLWAVLFGFATLNIIGLAARRSGSRRGLSFGEILAVLTVLFSIFLLAWEMLNMFHIFPLRLR